MAAGTVVGSFAVLALGLLSTFAFVFIKKSKRIKGRYFFTSIKGAAFEQLFSMFWIKSISY